jgi:hypothetical protein
MSTIKEEDKTFIKETSAFIENTNRESMKMIKEGILLAINRLQQYQQSEGSSGPYYLKEKDVLDAIELSYNTQVAEYEALRKDTIAGITGDKSEDDGKKIEQLQEITEDVWAKATAEFLPASNNNSSNGTSRISRYTTKKVNKKLSRKNFKKGAIPTSHTTKKVNGKLSRKKLEKGAISTLLPPSNSNSSNGYNTNNEHT